MNRAEFMRQLESLLQSIPAAEREEALQYYNDYFDDAGDENEQDVIEALGNPARVAENIKRDLLESGYGEVPPKKAVASDRKLIEYGEAENQAQANPALSREAPETDHRAQESGNGGSNNSFGSGTVGSFGGGTVGSFGSGTAGSFGGGADNGAGYAYAYAAGSAVPVNTGKTAQSGAPGKSGWPGWAVALLVVGLIFASPLITGLAGTLIGVLAAWIALIFVIGMVTLALFIVFAVLVAVGIMCMFADPVSGIALVGGGLLCGGIGILFLMLTVALAGIVTPAIFRGIAFLLGRRKKK